MESDLTSLLLQTIGLGTLSLFWVILNLHTYRNPERIEKNKEGTDNQWFKYKPEDEQKRLQRYRKRAKIMLMLAVLPVSLFLLSSFSLIVALWLRFR